MKSAERLLSVFRRLPLQARAELALALSDLASELLTVEPDSLDDELTELARLERELKDCEPADRVTAITRRMGFSRATYFRKRNILRTSLTSLKQTPLS